MFFSGFRVWCGLAELLDRFSIQDKIPLLELFSKMFIQLLFEILTAIELFKSSQTIVLQSFAMEVALGPSLFSCTKNSHMSDPSWR